MGSIQLGAVITRKISSLLMFIEGFRRCLTGIRLSRSSCDAVANFARASACEFSTLATSDLNPYEFFEQFTYLFEVQDHFLHPSLRRNLLFASPPIGNRCIPLVDQPP